MIQFLKDLLAMLLDMAGKATTQKNNLEVELAVIQAIKHAEEEHNEMTEVERQRAIARLYRD